MIFETEQNLLQMNNDIHFVDGAMIGEYARRNFEKRSETVRFLRYNSRICYVFAINVLFQVYRCPLWGYFFRRATNLDHVTSCNEKIILNCPCVPEEREHCLRNLTHSVPLIQKTKNSSKTTQFFSLNQSAWNMKIRRTPNQRHGLRIVFQVRFGYHPI